MTNYETMPDDELVAAMHAIQAEHSRRTILKLAQDNNAGLTDAYLTSIGRATGQPWTQPVGAHDSYPLGWEVTHGGKDWTSIVANNVWTPGMSGWRENVTDGHPAWVQPLGAHDAYATGAKVTHKGHIWQSSAASNVWEPGVYGWTDIGPA